MRRILSFGGMQVEKSYIKRALEQRLTDEFGMHISFTGRKIKN